MVGLDVQTIDAGASVKSGLIQCIPGNERNRRRSSSMVRALEGIENCFDIVEVHSGGRPDTEWRDDEPLQLGLLAHRIQAKTQKAVQRHLEGIAGAADLLMEQGGHIVIDGQRLSHIVMIATRSFMMSSALDRTSVGRLVGKSRSFR